MAAFLSGEMKDTVQMSPAATYVLDRYFNKRDRAKLFRSWAGSASMWIKVRLRLSKLSVAHQNIGRRGGMG
jgi:phospholipid:diacylglycerol acyltransferase